MFNSKIQLVVVLGFLALLGGCGKDKIPPGGSTPGGGGTAAGSTAVANIILAATPASVLTNGTSAIAATVSTAGGAAVPDGTVVNFALSSSIYGSLAAASATTTGGQTSVVFNASNTPGSVTVTASSGSINATTQITITAPAIGAIEFVSATPQSLGVRGSGQPETAVVRFRVRDINNLPVADGTPVSFAITAGPSGGRQPSAGGEYIGTDDGTPTTATGATTNGEATVNLTSGTISGTVTISASVAISGGGIATANSSVISIGGAVASARHFNIATSRFNLPGLVNSGTEATITAFVADRFGNFNVLTGTTVSFYTEAGAIDANSATGLDGRATAIFRTQSPIPDDVPPTAAEVTLVSGINATYGTSFPTTEPGAVHPRDGHLTVLATVNGEESFVDNNGNGTYDVGEAFTDIGEPFIDANDNGMRDPGEFFVDVNNNGVYDGPNGVWDGPGCTATGCQPIKVIWDDITLMFTGNASCVVSSTAPVNGFTIPDGGSKSFNVLVGDQNLNRLVPGTVIAVTASRGTLSGQTMFTEIDGVGGPRQLFFSVSDPDAGMTPPSTATTINITATPPAGSPVVGCIVTLIGNIN